MTDERDPELTPLLARAVRSIAETPEPSDLWRQRLHHRLETLRSQPNAVALEVISERRWSLRPLTAVAAALVCMVVGGATVYLGMRSGVAPTTSRAAAQVQRVRFVLAAPRAQKVAIVGDFNAWNPRALPMRRLSDGTWEIEVPLAPGRYTYSFIVDGTLAPDPTAPRAGDDDFGSPNSVVLVRGS